MRKLKRMISGIVATVMALTAMPVLASPTAVTNDTSIAGWRFTSHYSDSNIYIDRSQNAIGNASMKMVNRSPFASNVYATLETSAQVEKGKLYRLEFDAKAIDANKLFFSFNWGTRSSLTQAGATYDWMNYKFSYVPTEDEKVMLHIIADGPVGALWLDNMKFYDVTKPEFNLLANGDFENCSGPEETVEETITEPVTAETAEDIRMFAIEKAIVVDGKLDDWAGIDSMEITGRQDFDGPKEPLIQGNVRFAYDIDNLYFAVEVTDDSHYTYPSSRFWYGDSVQFGIADASTNLVSTLIERGIVYYEEEDSVWRSIVDFTVDVTREGNKTVYEVACPWSVYFGGDVPDAIKFNVIVNNSTSGGREYCLEITPGISMFKSATPYGHLFMLKPVGGVLQSSLAPKTLEVGEEGTLSVNLFNRETTVKTIRVSVDALDYEQDIIMQPGERKLVEIPFIPKTAGSVKLDIAFLCGGEEVVATKNISVSQEYGEEAYHEMRERIQGYAAELKELILEGEAQGLTLDYEVANYSIICKYLEYMELDVQRGYFERLYEFDKALTAAYEEAKQNITAYLEGEKQPLTVPRYVTGDKFTIDKKSVITNTFDGTKEEERPVMFVGYGTWETVTEEIPFFSSMGMNLIQTDVHIAEVMVTGRVNGWTPGISGSPLVDLAPSKEDKVSGEYAIKVVNNDVHKHNKFRYLYQEIPVKPNTTYVYGLKAKGTGLESNSAWFSAKGMAVQGRTAMENSEDWKNYDLEYTTGADETTLNLTMCFENTIDYLYIDDIYVMEKGTEENLLKNGDIEDNGLENMTPLEREAFDMGIAFDYDQLNWLRDVLARAEQYNMLVDVALCAHYIPSFILQRDPTMTQTIAYYMPYVLDHPTIRKVIDMWMQLVAEVVNDYDSVHTLLLANEPGYYTNGSYDGGTEYYIPHWQKYLKGLYGTVENLNEAYGSNYQSFEEVIMPLDVEHTPLWNDYRKFNDMMLADYLKWLYDSMKGYCPDLAMHYKTMDYFFHSYQKIYTNGGNHELIAQFSDLNGCDAFSYYSVSTAPLTMKMGWYDYQTSVRDIPVWDTESHIMQDRKPVEYDDLTPYYSSADVWNGAIHGRNGQVIWLWDLRNGSMAWGWANYANSNMVHRPETAVEHAKTALDLNRLSKEIVALQEVSPKVGMMYSRTEVGYNDYHVAKCQLAYEGIIFSGQKVGFVADTNYESMSKYDLLVIPEVTHISAEGLTAIKNYIENGGEVILMGDGCLAKDDYDKPSNPETLNYIYAHAESDKAISQKIQEMGLSEVVLAETETGEIPARIEWSCVEYDGKMLVNIMSYQTTAEVTVNIMHNGKEVKSFKELRSNETMTEEITLKPHQPVLIQFDI